MTPTQAVRKPVQTLTLDLPFPVSVNRLWRGGKGRVFKSRQYTAWLYDAGNALVAQKPGKVDGTYSLSVALSPPDKRKRDLDNFSTKAISDLLVAHGVVTDDSLCLAIHSRWRKDDGPRCLVTVLSVPPLTQEEANEHALE